MDKKLFFALIVEDFSDVKELYNQGKYLESFKLFEKKLNEIDKNTSPKGEVKSMKAPY